MNTLEARIIIENTGYYEDDEIDDIIDIYEELKKHIGWEDKRSDKRYIVKFHGIFWYIPNEWYNGHEQEYVALFDEFCTQMREMVEDEAKYKDIDIDQLLARMACGHYQVFNVDMPYIGEDNIIELAQKFYDEYNYKGKECLNNQIELVDILYSLEQNYMEYWFEFLDESEFPQKVLKEMREQYNNDKQKKGK